MGAAARANQGVCELFTGWSGNDEGGSHATLQGIVFVVDSADAGKLNEAKDVLFETLAHVDLEVSSAVAIHLLESGRNSPFRWNLSPGALINMAADVPPGRPVACDGKQDGSSSCAVQGRSAPHLHFARLLRTAWARRDVLPGGFAAE